MKNIFELGNEYAKKSSWKDFALLKLCLCAIGIVIGTNVPPQYKKTVTRVSAAVFIATYIPLMTKVFKIMLHDSTEITVSTEH
ncbi:permease of phosphate ABC transporter [Lachnospiraceae bacterium MD335]|nr:permease of phosphate ABC transporter [Lachnospiraceae bacterium MD335]